VDLGHILWRRRIERAHRIRIECRVLQKVLDLGIRGVIGFDHIRFEVRDRVVEVFPEHELVFADVIGCCLAHRSAGGVESLCQGWRNRSMVSARVARQRRQRRRIVWTRAGMGAAVVSELEAITAHTR
jgi:hypothetical protein